MSENKPVPLKISLPPPPLHLPPPQSTLPPLFPGFGSAKFLGAAHLLNFFRVLMAPSHFPLSVGLPNESLVGKKESRSVCAEAGIKRECQ